MTNDLMIRHPVEHTNWQQVAAGGLHTGGHGHSGFTFDHIQPIFPNPSHGFTAGNIGGVNRPSTLHYLFGGA